MRELLLAYLFGQLDGRQREYVERALADTPQLREELRRLKACMEAEEQGDVAGSEPPSDLVSRTCQEIARLVRSGGMEGHRDAPAAFTSRYCRVGADSDSYSRNRCSPAEFAAAVGVTVVLAMFIVPALHDSRVQARVWACQRNLHELGQGVTSYAAINGGAIPFVPAAGPDAFAGIFPVLLADGNVIDRQRLAELLICPATIESSKWNSDRSLLRRTIPTHEQVMSAPAQTLRVWRRELAGTLAYRIGYVDRSGSYREWRLDFSPRSAIFSDAPCRSRQGFQSDNHGGGGQNVYFADGHVEFLKFVTALPSHDHLYLNNAGLRAAACGEKDSVLSRSDDDPGVELLKQLLP